MKTPAAAAAVAAVAAVAAAAVQVERPLVLLSWS